MNDSIRRAITNGSYAEGTAHDSSDVDMLVVMPFRGNAIRRAAEIIKRLQPKFLVDLIVKTPAQLEHRLACNDFFLKDALTRGKALYESADERVGV